MNFKPPQLFFDTKEHIISQIIKFFCRYLQDLVG